MTDWRTQLREAVRDDEDERLSARDRLIMRRVVIGVVSTQPDGDVPFSWRSPLAVAAVVALMVLSGVIAGRWMPLSDDEPAVVQSVPDAGERRQVQFSTAGGTRIIWTIDPKFELNEVNP